MYFLVHVMHLVYKQVIHECIIVDVNNFAALCHVWTFSDSESSVPVDARSTTQHKCHKWRYGDHIVQSGS